MGKFQKILYSIFIVMFSSGIIIGLIGRALCVRDNNDYQTILPEIFVIEEINSILQDSDNNIYVCYNDASCVNVYDINGKFLWAVSVPYLRNSYFELNGQNLIVYSGEDAYLYNIINKTFVSKESSDHLNLNFDWENKRVSFDELKTDDVFFDVYNVYKMGADGSLKILIKKPMWYYIFCFPFDWLFSFIGIISAGVLLFIVKIKEYRKTRKTDKKNIKDKKLQRILKYIKIMIAIHVIYLVLNIIAGMFFAGILCIGIAPLTIHFIIANIIIFNIINKYDNDTIQFWIICNFASFVCAFLSVAVVASLIN